MNFSSLENNIGQNKNKQKDISDQTENKKTEESFASLFDATKGREYVNKVSPEIYEKFKKDFIQSRSKIKEKIETIKNKSATIEEMKKEIEELKVETERLGMDVDFLGPLAEQALFEARFDPVTGLKNRRELYKKTAPQIKELLGVRADEELDDEYWLHIIQNTKETFEDTDLHIMMSDISFLGLVNDLVGHNSGDKLLKNISDKMRTVVGECFRHGGDEITSTLNFPIEQLEKIKKQAQKEINNIAGLPGLESSALRPNIDIGFANFSEALKVYKELLIHDSEHKEVDQGELLDASSGHQEMDKNVLRNLHNIWLDIADKRTSIDKAKKRIVVLIDRFNNGQKINGALTKAAYGMDTEELKTLADKYNSGENIIEEIEEFIKQKEMIKLKEAGSREKKITELILKQVGVL